MSARFGQQPTDWTPGQATLCATTPALNCPRRLLPHGAGAHLVWVVPALAAGASRTYTVQEGSAAGGVSVTDGEHGVDVSFSGALFTTYRYASPVVKPYLYPVIGPTGEGMTRNYPMIPDVPGEKHDHPHHKSIYVSHGEVSGADVWSETPGHGFQRHLEFLPPYGDCAEREDCGGHVSGPVLGAIRSTNDWVGSDEQKVVEDERRFTFYPLASGARLIDVEITFRATAGPVHFADTKEGGILSLRVATSMDASGDGRMENAVGGIGEAECWGKRAQWLDYTGPVKGEAVGFRRLRPSLQLPPPDLLARAELRSLYCQPLRPARLLRQSRCRRQPCATRGRPAAFQVPASTSTPAIRPPPRSRSDTMTTSPRRRLPKAE